MLDAATGRPQERSRWSWGIHQALEAKHGLELKPENYNQARWAKCVCVWFLLSSCASHFFWGVRRPAALLRPPLTPTRLPHLRSITYPSLFSYYPHLAGMTVRDGIQRMFCPLPLAAAALPASLRPLFCNSAQFVLSVSPSPSPTPTLSGHRRH